MADWFAKSAEKQQPPDVKRKNLEGQSGEGALNWHPSRLQSTASTIMNILIILLILLLLGGGGYGFRSGNHYLGGGASLLVIILIILLLTGRI